MTKPPTQMTTEPRKTARQGRSAATVEAIVEAAARILETAGPSGFTTNAIAERAGVSVGSLYQYFPNKDAITRAVIRRELHTLEAQIMAIDLTVAEPSPLARLVRIAVAQQLQRPRLANLLEAEQDRLSLDEDSGPVHARVVDAIRAILGTAGVPATADMVQDITALIATLVNLAAARGDTDTARLEWRVEAVVLARLGVR
ncbi:TetR/AcrR family transcriptional regulator [Sphingomonas sp. 22176]|uniref:TetR/AcrR family transcriptional regulator n=1 Tax=Sphingomonas sp. 22176 TaxID=3453884 RepID=UPI003F82BC11